MLSPHNQNVKSKKLADLPRAYWYYFDMVWIPFDDKDSDEIEKGYYHYINGGSNMVSLSYHQRKIDLENMEESSQIIKKRKVMRGTWFWKEDDGSLISFSPEHTKILEEALQNGTFNHEPVELSKKPFREVQLHADGTFKQYRRSTNANPEGRDVVRGYMGHLCKCYENYPLPPHMQIFGADFSVVMKHPTNAGLPVPYLVYTALNMLSEKAGNTKHIFCDKEKLERAKQDRVKELETLFNLGDLLDITSEDIDVIACLLQTYIDALPDPLGTQVLYKQWSNAYVEDNLPETLKNIKKLLGDLPFINVYIMKRLVSVFSIASVNSAVTEVDVEALADQWTYPIFRAILVDEYNMNQVLVHLITHYDPLFSDINLQPQESLPQGHILGQPVHSSAHPQGHSSAHPVHSSPHPQGHFSEHSQGHILGKPVHSSAHPLRPTSNPPGRPTIPPPERPTPPGSLLLPKVLSSSSDDPKL